MMRDIETTIGGGVVLVALLALAYVLIRRHVRERYHRKMRTRMMERIMERPEVLDEIARRIRREEPADWE